MQQMLKMGTVSFLANCKSVVTCIPCVLYHLYLENEKTFIRKMFWQWFLLIITNYRAFFQTYFRITLYTLNFLPLGYKFFIVILYNSAVPSSHGDYQRL
jgi:hypothetical protein